MSHQSSKLNIDDIGNKLGLAPQFLFEAAQIASSQYAIFDLPKRSGGLRTICSPKDELKRLQRIILESLLWNFEMPEHVHGCVRGRSIVTNAQPHVNKPLVLTIDLKDFFGSVGIALVNRIFQDDFHCDNKSADTLTALTTYGNFLPQGAPTSPTLANIAALPLDADLLAICNENLSSFGYSRYVDDITISGDSKLAILLPQLYRAVHKHGFTANPDKLRVGRPSNRQKVTGVIVNKKLSAPKKLIRKIRQQLYYCGRFGIEDHCEREGILLEEFCSEINGLIGYIRLTSPEVADEFKIKLTKIQKFNTTAIFEEEEQKFQLLKYAIEEEKTVVFTYEDSHRRAAPAEISIDEDGNKIVRAYQIYPRMQWANFNIISIQSLQINEFKT
jgi:RNA-directed DNA polymerase